MIVLIKFLISIMAVIGLINPELSWKMSEGWKFKDAEPSDGYLVMTRISSVIILIIVWFVMPF